MWISHISVHNPLPGPLASLDGATLARRAAQPLQSPGQTCMRCLTVFGMVRYTLPLHSKKDPTNTNFQKVGEIDTDTSYKDK